MNAKTRYGYGGVRKFRSSSMNRSAMSFATGGLLVLMLVASGCAVYLAYSGWQACQANPHDYDWICGRTVPPPQVAFDQAAARPSQYASNSQDNYTQAVEVVYNQTTDPSGGTFEMGIFVPADLIPANYTGASLSFNSTQYLAVALGANVPVGTMANIIGNMDKAANATTGVTIYFIRASTVDAYGYINATSNPAMYAGLAAAVGFWNAQQGAATKADMEQNQSNNAFFFNWWIIYYFVVWSPNYYGTYYDDGSNYSDYSDSSGITDTNSDGSTTDTNTDGVTDPSGDSTSADGTTSSDSSGGDSSGGDGGGDAGGGGGD